MVSPIVGPVVDPIVDEWHIQYSTTGPTRSWSTIGPTTGNLVDNIRVFEISKTLTANS